MTPNGLVYSHHSNPTQELVRHAEEQAAIIRQQAGVNLTAKLDPFTVAKKLGFQVAYANQVKELSPQVRSSLQIFDASVWSGMCSLLPNGKYLILLNHNQTIERARVTILEEVSHVHYKHKPAKLDSTSPRTYDKQSEDEAYWTAGAILLPSKIIAQSVWRGQTAHEIASQYGASVELVEMRIKILRLWNRYKTRTA